MISNFDKAHMQEILTDRKGDVYDWFTAYLLRLIAKADTGNRERIRMGFPNEVAAFEEWYNKP